VKYTPCSKECYYVACIYIDRIIENNDLLVTSLNVHRLLITRYVSQRYFGPLFAVGGFLEHPCDGALQIFLLNKVPFFSLLYVV
jgi:hypothetical protein